MKLNVGCGKRILEGWTNCDIARDPEADRDPEILCDAKQIPLPDGCADVLMAIHLWEHIYRWDCDEVMTEWKRLLRPGGILILELPDMMKFCKNIIDGAKRGGKHPDQLGMWAAWGDPRTRNPYMNHKWGWSPDSLSAYLKLQGFVKITQKLTEFHPAGRAHRDMRIEAVKT